MVTIDEFRQAKDTLDVRMKHAVRDAQRAAKASLEAEANEVKRMLCELLASGAKIAEIHSKTGLARTTIYRYRDEYLALRGVDDVEDLAVSNVHSADSFESRPWYGGFFIRRNGEDAVFYDGTRNDFAECYSYDNQSMSPGRTIERPQWLTDDTLDDLTGGLYSKNVAKHADPEPSIKPTSEGFDFDLGEA